MGYIADKYRHRFALLISAVVLVLGTILWTGTTSLGGLPTLFAAQFLLGLGTGSLGVTRSYVVEQSSPEQRTYRLSWLSSLQYAGFCVTPFIGSALFVGGQNISSGWQFRLPPLILCLFAVFCLLLLVYPFQDIDEKTSSSLTKSPSSTALINSSDHQLVQNPMAQVGVELTERVNDIEQQPVTSTVHDEDEEDVSLSPTLLPTNAGNPLPPPPLHSSSSENSLGVYVAIGRNYQTILDRLKNHLFYLLILLNFTTRGAIAVYESLISATLLNDYGVSNLSLGLIVSGAGALGTFQLIFFKQLWSKHFSDYTLMWIGLSAILLSQSIVINWTKTEQKPLYMIVLATYVMYGFGYPIANSAVLGCFAKLQKTGRQAKVLSLFAFMGSLARVVMPVVSSQFELVEKTASFSIVAILMVFSLLGVFLYAGSINYFSSSTTKGSSSTVCTSTRKAGVAVAYGRNVIHGLGAQQYLAIGLCILATTIYLETICDWGVQSW